MKRNVSSGKYSKEMPTQFKQKMKERKGKRRKGKERQGKERASMESKGTRKENKMKGKVKRNVRS